MLFEFLQQNLTFFIISDHKPLPGELYNERRTRIWEALSRSVGKR